MFKLLIRYIIVESVHKRLH